MQLILIGFMGSGKTTISELLAQKMNVEVRDLDQLIVEHANSSIKDIFSQKGEPYFRQLEVEVLKKQESFDGILATGGGTVTSDSGANYIKAQKAPVIFLDVKDEDVHNRLAGRTQRPLANSKSNAELIELKHQRQPRYEECADYIVQTTGKTPEQVVAKIVDILNRN